LAVRRDELAGVDTLGIVFGGSGNGEQMAANKVEGVRAALVWSTETAALAREHNNANVCAIGARQHTIAEVMALIDVFLTTPFPGDERHVRRIGQMLEYETTGDIAGFVID
jgi:ribose 5-phosphate isomerase B